MPVLAWQRPAAAVPRMRSSSVPLRPATGSDARNAGPGGSSLIPSSTRTMSCGEVLSLRDRPEPSTTVGCAPSPETVSSTTLAPAAVEPEPPKLAPSALTRLSAR